MIEVARSDPALNRQNMTHQLDRGIAERAARQTGHLEQPRPGLALPALGVVDHRSELGMLFERRLDQTAP
jgi:hypothetical protein